MIPSTSSSGMRLPGTKIASAPMAARKAIRMPVATPLLTSTPASSNGSLTIGSLAASRETRPAAARSRSCCPVQTLDGDGGALACHPVSLQNVGDVVDVPGARVEGLGIDGGDRGPRDAAVEERRHRDLVGAA